MATFLRGSRVHKNALALQSEPNVIPFIDVLLVLLVIFMVTAPIPTADIRVDLPPPYPVHAPQREQAPTIVSLVEEPAGFALFVDGEPAQLSQLGARTLDHAIANNPGLNVEDIFAEARIFLRADQSTAYANVVNVMTLLQDAGFVKVGIFAETAAES